jgi:zinc/manganese transport system permease protein
MTANVLNGLFQPGFFSSSTVQHALLVGAVVAFTSAVVGVFTVIRRQSFAGEALGDVGTTGGSAAFMFSLNPLVGFIAATLLGAGVIEVAGTRRSTDRDLATGIVLGASLGLAALFLYVDSNRSSTTGASITVLFGTLFVINPDVIPAVIALAAGVLLSQVALHRALLLASLSPDLAAVKGVRVRLVGAVYLLTVAVAVALAALTIGAVLSTALLIGPPLAALRLCRRPGRAIVVSGLLGVAATWIGVLLAYDSYAWPPVGHGWPVSFFVVAVIFAFYLAATALSQRRLPRVVERRRTGAA